MITTERLRLPLVDAAFVADLRAGVRRPEFHPDFPRQDDLDGFGMWREGDPWGSRVIVRGRTALGTIGFFGPPEDADEAHGGGPEVEVGYGLVAEAWGWGFATEALRALLAHVDPLGVRVRASTEPENARSLRVLAKAGFTSLRGADEEGHLVLARPLPATAS